MNAANLARLIVVEAFHQLFRGPNVCILELMMIGKK